MTTIKKFYSTAPIPKRVKSKLLNIYIHLNVYVCVYILMYVYVYIVRDVRLVVIRNVFGTYSDKIDADRGIDIINLMMESCYLIPN